MLKNLKDKKFGRFLKYGKDRVIKIESDGSSDSGKDDQEDESDGIYSNDCLHSDYGKETEPNALTPMKNAIGYSIIKGMDIPSDLKQKLLMKMTYNRF